MAAEAVQPVRAELRVLGIADTGAPTHTDYWLWCRRHKQAVKVGFKCHDGGWPTHWFPLDGCIHVGPFMTEAEAWRLDQNHTHTHAALGMEVER